MILTRERYRRWIASTAMAAALAAGITASPRVGFPACPQGLTPAAPQAAPAAADAAFREFEALAARAMAQWKVPGLAAAVVRDGRLVYAQGFGFRDLARGLKVTPRTLFGIGSCSKAFTAATMGILVDEGRLAWDKPVRSYLPEFRLADPLISEKVTPRDLISHRTGLPRHDHVWIRSPLTRREMFERLRFLDLNRDLRQTYQYNNLMVMTAGYLVGTIAGTSWEEFARSRILEPLGMKDTNFSTADSQKAEDFSQSYTLVDGKPDLFPFYSADALGPAGSINSTVLDMAQWLLLNLNKGRAGERRLVSEERMAEIHAPQIVVPDSGRTAELLFPAYAMGWRTVAYRGRPMLSHGGAIMGFSAMTVLLPADGIGVVLLNNLEDAPINGPLAYTFIDRLLGLAPVDWYKRALEDEARGESAAARSRAETDLSRKTGTSPSHALADYAGVYEHPSYGTISVVLEDGRLKADFHQRSWELGHYHYDVFRMRNDWMNSEYLVTFALDRQGRVSGLAVPFESNVQDIVFDRKDKAAPAAVERSVPR